MIVAETNAFLVNTTTASYQSNPDVASIGDGGFMVVWASGPYQLASPAGPSQYPQIHGRAFEANGDALGGQFQISTIHALHDDPTIIALEDRYLVTWALGDDSNWGRTESAGRAVSPDGTPLGSEQVFFGGSGWRFDTMAAPLEGGGFVAAGRYESQIQLQTFDPAGVPLSPVVSPIFAAEGQFDIAPASGGEFWLFYTGETPDAEPAFLLQRFSASGSRLGDRVLVTEPGPSGFGELKATALSDGDILLTWSANGQIVGRVLDADSGSLGDSLTLGEVAARRSPGGVDGLMSYDIAALPDGAFVVVRETGVEGQTSSLYSEVFANDGTVLQPAVLVDVNATSATLDERHLAQVAVLDEDSYVIVWQDSDGAHGDTDSGAIVGQVFTFGAVQEPGFALSGDRGDDNLAGGAGGDTLGGDRGDDLLEGNAGGDMLVGDRGDDTLVAGAGDDILIGGRGDDLLEGGAGADLYFAQRNMGDDVILGFDAAAGDRIRLDGVRVREIDEVDTDNDGIADSTDIEFNGGEIRLLGVVGVPEGTFV